MKIYHYDADSTVKWTSSKLKSYSKICSRFWLHLSHFEHFIKVVDFIQEITSLINLFGWDIFHFYIYCLITFVDFVDVPAIHFVPYHICQEENNGPHVELCLPRQTLIFLFLQLGTFQANLGSLTFATEKKSNIISQGRVLIKGKETPPPRRKWCNSYHFRPRQMTGSRKTKTMKTKTSVTVLFLKRPVHEIWKSLP